MAINIRKLDKATKRILNAADIMRAGRRSAPQHFEAADIEVIFHIVAREFEARLGAVAGYSTVSAENALTELADALELHAQAVA